MELTLSGGGVVTWGMVGNSTSREQKTVFYAEDLWNSSLLIDAHWLLLHIYAVVFHLMIFRKSSRLVCEANAGPTGNTNLGDTVAMIVNLHDGSYSFS